MIELRFGGVSMNYLSSMETAKAMGITVRRVQQMCKQGEISGAVKKGHSWLIPENAVWPDSGEKKKADAHWDFLISRRRPQAIIM